MFRYVVPLVLIVGAFLIRSYNNAHRYKKIVFPGLASMGTLKDDLHMQGQYTWYIVLALGLVVLLVAAWTSVADYRRRQIEIKGHKPKDLPSYKPKDDQWNDRWDEPWDGS